MLNLVVSGVFPVVGAALHVNGVGCGVFVVTVVHVPVPLFPLLSVTVIVVWYVPWLLYVWFVFPLFVVCVFPSL